MNKREVLIFLSIFKAHYKIMSIFHAYSPAELYKSALLAMATESEIYCPEPVTA